MPISNKEKKKLASHDFSEVKIREMESIYGVHGEFGVGGLIASSLNLLRSKLSCLVLNIPESAAFCAYLFFVFTSNSVSNYLYVSLVFIAFQLFVSGAIGAVCAARLVEMKGPGVIASIGIAISYLRPLAYVFVVGVIYLALLSHNGVAPISGNLLYIALAAGGVIALVLHIINANNAIALHFYSEKGISRSVALGKSWHSLSNQSPKVLLASIALFLPTILLTLGYVMTLSLAFLAIDFLSLILSLSLWQALCASLYLFVKANAKDFDYSRL